MRHVRSREKLFSLLALTEGTILELTDTTLDQNVCELFICLYLGSKHWGSGAGFLDPESLATTHLAGAAKFWGWAARQPLVGS